MDDDTLAAAQGADTPTISGIHPGRSEASEGFYPASRADGLAIRSVRRRMGGLPSLAEAALAPPHAGEDAEAPSCSRRMDYPRMVALSPLPSRRR
jgi:hypothetical protein